MLLKVYKGNDSPPTRAAMMIRDLLDVDIKLDEVDPKKSENLTPDFVQKNPSLTLPALEDGDLLITDSHVILMYLADVHSNSKKKNLYPKEDVKARAQVNQKLFFNSSILYPRLCDIMYPMTKKGLTKISKEQHKAIDEAYGILEQFLRRSKYLAAKYIKIADIAAYATTSSLAQLVNNTGSQEMVLTLYKLNPSPPARAAMMICDLLKVDVKMVDVNLMTGEHLTPDFLKKNPTHTIPVLEDGDLTITDSHAILMYLADVYSKDNTLYPKDVKQRALVNQKLFFNSSILFARLRNITYPILIEGLTEIPEKLLKAIDEAYGYLEEFLSRSKYLAANHITIADIAAYATTSSLAQLLKLDPKKYPKALAWHAVMEQNLFVQRQNTAGVKQIKELVDAKLGSKK